MQEFNFDYDLEHDDLFVYKKGSKSKGSVELDDFVFDFNSKGELVAVEIVNASKVISEIIKKSINILKDLNSCKIDIIVVRNKIILANLVLETDGGKTKVPLSIPRVSEPSPALRY